MENLAISLVKYPLIKTSKSQTFYLVTVFKIEDIRSSSLIFLLSHSAEFA